MSEVLKFIDDSNDFRYSLMCHLDTSYELYAKISHDHWIKLLRDPNSKIMFDYYSYRYRKDGCIAEMFGVKLVVCNQEHDYEFLIKI